MALYLTPERVSVRVSCVYVPPPLAPSYLPVPPVILYLESLSCEPQTEKGSRHDIVVSSRAFLIKRGRNLGQRLFSPIIRVHSWGTIVLIYEEGSYPVPG